MRWVCTACAEETSSITNVDAETKLCRSCSSQRKPDAFICECGKWDAPSNWIGGLKGNLCLHCERWEEIIAKRQDASVRIDGSHYMVDWKSPMKPVTTKFLGFAGRTFTLRFHDGREIQTNDLWHQGPIPERFRDRLPDNAVFA